MSRNTARFTLVLLAASSLVSGTIQNEECEPPPYEEDECNFAHQNASEAVKINGKIYVKSQNFNSTLPPLCDSAERVASINDTYFIFTLAAVLPYNDTYVVKFNTSFVLSKTGNHTDYNAMTYKYETMQPAKLRKLMYMNDNKSCMIFIDDRNSTSEPAPYQAKYKGVIEPIAIGNHEPTKNCFKFNLKQISEHIIVLATNQRDLLLMQETKAHEMRRWADGCQLLQPAEYADQNVTADCQDVYDKYCPGPSRTVYFPWCKNLTEVSLDDFIKSRGTTTSPQSC